MPTLRNANLISSWLNRICPALWLRRPRRIRPSLQTILRHYPKRISVQKWGKSFQNAMKWRILERLLTFCAPKTYENRHLCRRCLMWGRRRALPVLARLCCNWCCWGWRILAMWWIRARRYGSVPVAAALRGNRVSDGWGRWAGPPLFAVTHTFGHFLNYIICHTISSIFYFRLYNLYCRLRNLYCRLCNLYWKLCNWNLWQR